MASWFVVARILPSSEHEELVERRRRIEERAEVYLDINSQCGGTGGMKDVESRIIVHDQGILPQGFTALRAVFRETLNACPLEMFVSDDEHGGSFLTSSTLLRVLFEKSIPSVPALLACSEGLFYRNERVQQYVPPS